jgi:hypothetical protein
MSTSTRTNLRAGFVTLRVTDRSRVLTHQVEADSELDSLCAAIREAVTRLVEAHAAAGRAHVELVQANRLVSDATFVPEQVAS